MFIDSRKLAYFTDKGFDETVELIIKEDERNRATKGLKEDSNSETMVREHSRLGVKDLLALMQQRR